MWRVQAFPDLVFEFLPRYQSFQIELKDAEVEGALVAQRSRELTFDVAGGGQRHGKRRRWSDRLSRGSTACSAVPTIILAERSSTSQQSDIYEQTTTF